MKSDPGYYPLFEKIGEVSSLWSAIEQSIRTFVFDRSCWHDGRFMEKDEDTDTPGAFICLVTALGHLDSRGLVATAKVLAHWVQGIDLYYERVETLLNQFDNDIRMRRNRYIHDSWTIWGDKIKRFKSGSVVKRESGTGERKYDYSPAVEFSSLDEIGQLATEMREALLNLDDLAQEVRDAAYEKWRPAGYAEQ